MGDVVNLNQYRKQREKSRKARESAQNRALFGLSKDERTVLHDELERGTNALDGKKLDSSGSEEPPQAG